MNHVLDHKRANVALTHRLAANDPRGALLDRVVEHGRAALAAYGRGDMAAFRAHATAARTTNAQIDELGGVA